LKKSWVLGILKLASFGYLVVYLENNRRIFEDKALSLQDFKLYLLIMLHSWSQVLDCGTKVSLLDIVDRSCIGA